MLWPQSNIWISYLFFKHLYAYLPRTSLLVWSHSTLLLKFIHLINIHKKVHFVPLNLNDNELRKCDFFSTAWAEQYKYLHSSFIFQCFSFNSMCSSNCCCSLAQLCKCYILTMHEYWKFSHHLQYKYCLIEQKWLLQSSSLKKWLLPSSSTGNRLNVYALWESCTFAKVPNHENKSLRNEFATLFTTKYVFHALLRPEHLSKWISNGQG